MAYPKLDKKRIIDFAQWIKNVSVLKIIDNEVYVSWRKPSLFIKPFDNISRESDGFFGQIFQISKSEFMRNDKKKPTIYRWDAQITRSFSSPTEIALMGNGNMAIEKFPVSSFHDSISAKKYASILKYTKLHMVPSGVVAVVFLHPHTHNTDSICKLVLQQRHIFHITVYTKGDATSPWSLFPRY